jgi:hypothetical protein
MAPPRTHHPRSGRVTGEQHLPVLIDRRDRDRRQEEATRARQRSAAWPCAKANTNPNPNPGGRHVGCSGSKAGVVRITSVAGLFTACIAPHTAQEWSQTMRSRSGPAGRIPDDNWPPEPPAVRRHGQPAASHRHPGPCPRSVSGKTPARASRSQSRPKSDQPGPASPPGRLASRHPHHTRTARIRNFAGTAP